MMIFITSVFDKKGTRRTQIIPDHKVDSIEQLGCRITIEFRTGEMVSLGSEDYGASFAEKQDCITINYPTEQLALKAIEDYYKACNSRAGAFSFFKR